MVYDHGLRCLGKAQGAFDENGDIDRMNCFTEHLLEAQNCITELACALDIERGGEMAIQIERLYEFMLHHLMESIRLGRREPVDVVKQMLAELRDGWAQAMASVPREEQPEPIPVERRSSSFNFNG